MARILLMLFCLLGLMPGAQAQESSAQSFVERMLENMLATERRSVSIEGLSVSLTGAVTAGRVEVRDGEEPWLVLEDLSLDWAPLSLFRQSLEINELRIATIDLRRLPQTAEGGVAAPKEASDLTAADIKRVRINRLGIAAAVAGEATTLSIEGSAQIKQTSAEIRLDLTAERTDAKQGRLTANVVINPIDRQLAVDIDLNEPADGFVANALNLSGEPAVDLALSARGTVSDWSGDFSLDLDKQRVMAGKAQSASEGAGQRLSVDGGGEMERLVPARLAPFFKGSSQLVASVLFEDERQRLDIQRIRLASDTFQLRAAGPLDWRGDGSDMTLELRPNRPDEPVSLPDEGFGALDLVGLSADLRVQGSLAALRWSFKAAARSALTDPVKLEELSLDLGGVGFIPAEQPVTAQGVVKGTLAHGRTEKLPPVVPGPIDARLSAAWQQGGALRLVEMTADMGKLRFAGGGNFNLNSRAFDLNAKVETDSPETGSEILDQLLEGPVALSGRFEGDGRGGIRIENAMLDSVAATARLDGQWSTAAIDLSFDGAIEDLNRLHEEVTGKAQVKGKLAGAPSALDVTIDAEGEDIALLDKPLDEPRLRAQLRLSDRLAGQLDFSGRLNGKPVSIAGRLENAQDGARVLRDVAAKAGATELTGELRLPQTGAPAGQFRFNSPDLRDVAPLLLMELRGSASGRIDVEPVEPDGRMKVVLEGRNIASNQFSARTLDGNIDIEAPLRAPRPQGRLALTQARVAGLALSTLGIDARSTGERTYSVSLDAAGDIAARAAVDVAMGEAATTISVRRLSGRTRGIPFQISGPFTVRMAAGATTVGDAAFAIGKGRVSLSGKVAPQFDARLGLTGLPLSAFEQLVGQPGLDGTLTGEARLTGTTDAPGGNFNLRADGVTAGTLRDFGLRPLSVTAEGALANRRLSLRGSGRSGDVLTASFDGSIDIGTPMRLDIRLNGRAGSRLFADRLADRGLRLEGNARFDLRVSGPLDDPALNGSLSVTGMTFGDTGGRFILRNGMGNASIANNVLRITSLGGRTGKNGRASLSGTIALDSGQAVDLRAEIRNGIYVDGTLVNTRYDANLRMTGSLSGTPLISGKIELEKAKITLSERPPTALQPLDVDHVHASKKVRRQVAGLRRRVAGGNADVQLNVTLRASTPISVSGRGLNVALGGRLQLTGPLSAPQAQGAFRLIRGRLALVARRLEFDRGELNFQGDLDPRIHLVAVSRRSDATITLTITGLASAPEIMVSSSPDMPQEEALARLMFDRSMLQLSPLQLAQIASSISVLAGGSDSGLLSQFRNALGVDWLEVTETETGETAIGIGKQVNDRLSVGVEQTTKTNASQVTIDLNLTKNLKARGALGMDGLSRTGVVFEKDY
jgi:translocation and assembly module TamB